MENEKIQLDINELNNEFNNKVCDYYQSKEGQITWDDEYNIKNELAKVKKIWKKMLNKKCEKVIQSKTSDKKVDENEVKKFYDDQFKKYEDSWELTDDNFPLYFLEAFEEETIDSSEKLEKLINFTKNDLKFKDDFYDDYFMSYIIDLLKVGEKSTLTKDNLFWVLDLNKGKKLSLSTLSNCAHKFELDYSCFEKLLSCAENFILPDAKSKKKDHNKQVEALFNLMWWVLFHSYYNIASDDIAKEFSIAQKIFASINKSTPKFKHLLSEIDKHKSGVKLSKYLNEHCIKFVFQKNSDDSDIKVAIDYFVWFNKIILNKLYNDLALVNSYSCAGIHELNKLYDTFVLNFSNEIKKYGIDITEDIKKELVLNRDSFDKILEKINNNIIKSSDDFNGLIEFIKSKTKDIDITSNKFRLLIIDYRLNMSDMNKFLKLDKNNSLSISDISCFLRYKIGTGQKYRFDDITKFLLVAKNRFTKSKKSKDGKKEKKYKKDDVEAFCDLLVYFLSRVDENETEYIKFEQNVFDWVAENIPEVEFLKGTIKSSDLKNALKHRWVRFNDSGNNKLEADFSALQEKFESFVQQKATKYQDLNELSKACDTLIDEFLKSKQVDPTRIQKVIKAGYEKDLKQALRVRESKSIELFIKNIAPGIIKSSDDIKIFLENINKVVDNPIDISNCDSFMNSVINLIVDGAVDISDMLKVLTRFLAKKDEKSGQKKGTKDKLKLTTLLKCCQKIKDGSKWNFDQIKEFLKYGFANKNKKDISEDVGCFLGLLIIFVSNADLKNKNENDPNEADNEADDEDDIDMTHEKFVNKILAYAKKLYFKQKNFSWSEHFEFCGNFGKLEKVLTEKNINIPELQQNKSSKNTGTKDEKIKNKEKNKINIEYVPTNNKGELNANSTTKIGLNDNRNNNVLKINNTFIPIDSAQKNLQDQDSKTTFTSTTKISYLKLIAKIVLYALTVIAFSVLIFSIIKAFWFLAMLSCILFFCFVVIAYKIKYKTICKEPKNTNKNINSGYEKHQKKTLGLSKNKGTELNQSNQMPGITEVEDEKSDI